MFAFYKKLLVKDNSIRFPNKGCPVYIKVLNAVFTSLSSSLRYFLIQQHSIFLFFFQHDHSSIFFRFFHFKIFTFENSFIEVPRSETTYIYFFVDFEITFDYIQHNKQHTKRETNLYWNCPRRG